MQEKTILIVTDATPHPPVKEPDRDWKKQPDVPAPREVGSDMEVVVSQKPYSIRSA